MSTEDALARDLRLGDLVNPEALANICSRFTDMFRVDLVVTDADGTSVHGHVESQALFFEPSAQKFVRFGSPGSRFLRARVDNQLEPVGYVFLGPVNESSASSSADRPDAERALQFLCTILEEITYANYQSWLSARLSLEVTRNHLGELVDKEAELHRYEETLRASEDLRSLF